jgi:TonB-linked SusC/RagA family outer membrane protein
MADLKWRAYKNSGLTPTGILYGKGDAPVLPDYIQPEGAMEGDPGTDPSEYYVDPDYTGDEYYDFHRITKANKRGTDWYHAIFKPAPITSHNLTISGGGDNGNYLFSLNYFDQKGTLIYTYLKRYSIRSNTQYNVSRHIRVGENMVFSVSDNHGADILTGNSSDAPISSAFRMQPIVPVYDIMGNFAGTYGQELGDAANPVAIMYRKKNDKGLDNRLFGNVFADIDFLKYFTFHTSFGGAIDGGWSHSFDYPTYENSENTQTNEYEEGSYHGYNWTWTNTLTFQKIFSNDHRLKVMIGSESHEEKGGSSGGSTQDYFSFDPDYVDLSTGSGVRSNYSSDYQSALYSLFGRVDYAYKDKYLVSGTLRRDGSSKLVNYRYGWFPAVSAAWRISKEKFMADIPWLTDLKVRGSWGIMGNQRNLDADNAYTLYNSSRSASYYDIRGTNNSTVLGFQQARIGNPDAKWESDVNADAGIDATLFDGKLEITADYYWKNIKDLLYDPELPGVAGVASPPYINIANMKNTGIDLSASGNMDITSNLKLNATLTFTTYKNTILKVSGDADYFDEDHIRNQVGHSLSTFFGYKIAGFWDDQAEIDQADALAQKVTGDEDAVYQEEEGVGRFRYADINGANEKGELTGKPDGQITPADRTYLGNPNPVFTAGLNLGLTYRSFDFSVFLYDVYGNKIWNGVKWWTDFFNHSGANSKTALYDSWTPDHHHAKAPIQLYVSNFSTNGESNSYFVENGSYLRVKNVQVGYTFPKSLLSGIGIQYFRIYLQAANLFTFTRYTGIDPEIGGGVTEFGVDDGTYPSQREFLAGISLTF